MKSITEFLMFENKIEVPQIHPSLSKEANLDCVLFLCDYFYNQYTAGEIRKTFNNIDKWRCPLSHANNTMSDFLQDKLNEWIEEREYDWEDDDDYKNDLKVLDELKDGYFDDDDFFWHMPTRQEFKQLQKQNKK